MRTKFPGTWFALALGVVTPGLGLARAQGVAAPPRVISPGAPAYYVYPPHAYVYPPQAYRPATARARPRRGFFFRPRTAAARDVPHTVENGYYTSIWDYYRD